MPSAERWLLRDVRVGGTRTDCRIRDGRVADLRPRLPAADGERIIIADGGELLPGLADHHIHLQALAAARRSLDLAGAALADAVTDVPGDGWLRVIGAGEELKRADLDAVWPGRPVRVQHRSGALWTLNSPAIGLLRPGATGEEMTTGQFWRSGARLRALLDLGEEADLAAVSAELARYGVTHVTDATPDADPATLTVAQHVLSLAGAGTGPLKLVVADHDLPSVGGLVHAILAAHASGRGAALHVVSAPALALVLAAFGEAGGNGADRVEHAAVCDDDSARRLAGFGITVVTQPSILARHGGSYLRHSEPHERPLLWRNGGLSGLGVRVSVSSDAPYGDPCPWVTVRAAALRLAGDVPVGPECERADPSTTLCAMLADPASPAGPPRRVVTGARADLCLLGADLEATFQLAVRGRTELVRATFIDGTCVYSSENSGS